MTIKEFAYSAQQHLQALTGNNFKRAHIYELLAASFGYNSFAALCSESVVTQEQQEVKIVSQHNHNLTIRQRCIELGYQPTTADMVSSELLAFVEACQINVIRLSTLVTNLRRELSYQDEYSDWNDEDETTDWDAENEAFSPQLLTGLEAAASKDNALAHYALALIHMPAENYEHEFDSDSWYDQEQKHWVRVIKDVKEPCMRKNASDEKYEFHLREAAVLVMNMPYLIWLINSRIRHFLKKQ